MKLWAFPMLALGAIGIASAPRQDTRQILVLYGRNQGYLSPCGCTSPMSGGIRRAATAVRQLELQGAGFVFVGGNEGGISRQDELKAETSAETARSLNGSYSFEKEEAALGPGMLLEFKSLTDDKLFSSAIEPSANNSVVPRIQVGNISIGSASFAPETIAPLVAEMPKSIDAAVSELLSAAQSSAPVLITDGDLEQARSIAQRYPALRAVVYRSASDPPTQPPKVGDTLLVTTGHHGKAAVSLTFEEGKVIAYNVLLLGPDIPDDEAVSRIYLRYLQRVAGENLLGQLPRQKTAKYIGSQACASCHSKAYAVWERTGHAHALKDLDDQHHGRDPDCVGCHVVALNSIYGFTGESKTPQFSNVGCESCHGPSRSHTLHPYRFHLPKVQAAQCVTCHTTDNSPGFVFAPYWAKIKH